MGCMAAAMALLELARWVSWQGATMATVKSLEAIGHRHRYSASKHSDPLLIPDSAGN